MRYFKKVIRGSQTYIYRVESVEGSEKKSTYLGNINNLSEDVLQEVNDYFFKKNLEKQYKGGDVEYEEVLDDTLAIENKLFGDLWLVYQIEKMVKVIDIVDENIIGRKKISRLTPGMYLFIAVANRLIDPVSKNKLGEWLAEYDTNEIFGKEIDPSQFNSNSYYQIFNNIDDEIIDKIGNKILQSANKIVGTDDTYPGASFDITNLFTYIAIETKEELPQTGKNKQGRDSLNQIGLAYFMQHRPKMLLHYKVFPGNIHDSKLFSMVIDEMFIQAEECGKSIIIVIFDKGNNSESNIKVIDEKENVEFITSYSTSYDPTLVSISLDHFEVIDCKHNRDIDEEINKHPDNKDNLEANKIKAYTLVKEYWGKKRFVVIVYNPKTAKKQQLRFQKNVDKLTKWLNVAKERIKLHAPHYTTKASVVNLYNKKAREAHLRPEIFNLTFSNNKGMLKLNYSKNRTFIKDYTIKFGKNILISSDLTFTAGTVIDYYFSHYVVEEGFRQSKDDECCCIWQIYHRKDKMIKVHILFCVASLCFLRILESILKNNGINKTGKSVIKEMHKVIANHIILPLPDLQYKKYWKLSNITKEQREIFSLFCYEIIRGRLKHK